MGTWATAIFADDVASDVRSDFRNFLADAQSLRPATDKIVESYGARFDDLSTDTAFWLGLALTQWGMGRLDRRVKDAALQIIDGGLDLKNWEGSPEQARRAAVLAKARIKILSPLPSACPLPRPIPVQLADWKIGEVVGYRTDSGRLALLHVVRFSRWTKHKAKAPAVAFLNWFRNEMPTQKEIGALTDLAFPLAPSGIQTMPKLILSSPRSKPLDITKFIRQGLFLDLLPGELVGSGIGIIGEHGETLDSIVEKALRRWWDEPTLSPKAPPPWLGRKR
jgi:hypothetical protein